MDDLRFYTELPVFNSFEEASVSLLQKSLPSDWHIIVTDVKESTRSINDGNYREINATGAASIIAVFNALGTHNIPFSFGGDGAVICLPESLKESACNVLASLAHHIKLATGFELRVGSVPVSVVEEHGAKVKIGRYHLSEVYDIAVFSGGGIEVAERLIKEENSPYQIDAAVKSVLDLNGLECRWKPVPGPYGKVLALIVKARGGSDEANCSIYQNLLLSMKDIYGGEQLDTSLSEEDLQLCIDSESLQTEITIHGSRWRTGRCLILKGVINLGRILMKYNVKAFGFDWAIYMSQLKKNTDHRKFVDGYQHLISGSDAQHEAMLQFLEEERKRGALYYGTHITDHLLITCLVFDYDSRHIHFADGTEGGFAMAAVELKKQLQEARKEKESTQKEPDSLEQSLS